jgi:glyoxylase-like metal-dependent hydrolase (beta-lactamase superfamily II)
MNQTLRMTLFARIRIWPPARLHAARAFFMAACLLTLAPQQTLAQNYVHFNWEQVVDGVWFGVTQPNSFQTGNTVIIALPGSGSMVVDSHNSEYLAAEIIAKVKEVAPGPVRYLVNTHLHQDHVGGNVAFRKAYPKVEIIAHRNTCWGIPDKTVPRMKVRVEPMVQQLGVMRKTRAAAAEAGRDTAVLDRQIAGTDLYLKDAQSFEWVMPTTCLNLSPGQMRTITAGNRRIEIRYMGRGHSAGDLVVYLPKEKVIAVGDLWSEGGNILLDSGIDGRDGSVLDVPATLRAVKSLNFDVALPGHRALIAGKASLDLAIANSEKFNAQILESHLRGETVLDAMRKMPPPAPQIATFWNLAVSRGFEELELRKQFGTLPKSR